MKKVVTFHTPDSWASSPKRMALCEDFYRVLGTSNLAHDPATSELVNSILKYPFEIDGWRCELEQSVIDYLHMIPGNFYSMSVKGPGA